MASKARPKAKGKRKAVSKPPLIALLGLEDAARAVKKSVPTVRNWLNDVRRQYNDGDPDSPVVEWGGNGRPYQINATRLLKWVGEQDEKERLAEAARQAEITKTQNSLDLEGGQTSGLSAVPFDIRKKAFDSELSRQKAAKGRGQLVEATLERAEWDRVFAFLATNLQALPDYLARECDLPTAVVAQIEEKVRDWQETLARQLMDREDLTADVSAIATGTGSVIPG